MIVPQREEGEFFWPSLARLGQVKVRVVARRPLLSGLLCGSGCRGGRGLRWGGLAAKSGSQAWLPPSSSSSASSDLRQRSGEWTQGFRIAGMSEPLCLRAAVSPLFPYGFSGIKVHLSSTSDSFAFDSD